MKTPVTQDNFIVPYHVHNGVDSPRLGASGASTFQELKGILTGTGHGAGVIPNGTGATLGVFVAGASVGDFVLVSFSANLAGVTMTGYVSAPDFAAVRIQNGSGGPFTLSITDSLNVLVIKYP